jgi:hypothetical protein
MLSLGQSPSLPLGPQTPCHPAWCVGGHTKLFCRPASSPCICVSADCFYAPMMPPHLLHLTAAHRRRGGARAPHAQRRQRRSAQERAQQLPPARFHPAAALGLTARLGKHGRGAPARASATQARPRLGECRRAAEGAHCSDADSKIGFSTSITADGRKHNGLPQISMATLQLEPTTVHTAVPKAMI